MITLQLFGTFSAKDDNQFITTFRSGRARALLAYLAVESHIPLWRDKLAALLWSDMPDGRARRNLSVTLTRLQDALNTYTPDIAGQLINTTLHTLQLQPEAKLWCDVLEMEKHLTAVAFHTHATVHTCDACLARLATGVQLYTGEFLAGFSVEGAPLFEEWLTLNREAYHQKILVALNTLTESMLVRQDYEAACHYAQQQLGLEPWLEHAHYQYMRALYHKGERSQALHQFEICRTQLATEFGVLPGNEITAFYKQMQSGGEVSNPESHRKIPPTTFGSDTIPRTPNRFLGREVEQAQLEHLLGGKDAQLVTIVGSGGMGKTRLATEVGYAMRHQFADGVWFVSLVGMSGEGVTDAKAALIRAISEVVPMTLRPNVSAESLLLATLQSQEMLLILDNMEHLLEGAPLIGDLLRAAPSITVLCTSRAPLKLRAEWVFPLAGLPVPLVPPQNDNLMIEVEPSSSIQLFVGRARQGVPSFELTAANRASVIAICTKTNGSPLGIELAAAMMRYRSPQRLAAQLQQSLDAIYSDQRDVEARHRSLRAIFTTSWELLNPREQTVLSRLSLFRAPFGIESALAIAGATLVNLDALLDQSLITAVGDAHYELHVLVRDYAAERLVASGTHDRGLDDYCRYFLGLLVGHYPALLGMEPRSAMASLHMVMADIRTAWNRAVDGGEVTILAEALPPLTRYLMMNDSIGGMGMNFEEDAIRLKARFGDSNEATTVSLIGALWVAAAQTTLTHAPLDVLMQAGETVCRLAQGIESVGLEAHGWRIKGLAQLLKGSVEQAETYLYHALTLARHSKDTHLLILCLGAFRTPLAFQRAAAAEALSLATHLGDGWTLAQLQTNIGGAYYFAGNLVQAQQAFQQAIAYYKHSGHRRRLATLLNNMGDVYRVLGQYEQATALHQIALQTAHALGDRWNEQSVLEGMARYHRDMGDLETARDLVGKAIAIVTGLDIVVAVANHYNLLGLIALEQGDWEQAEQAFADAIRLCSEGGHRHLLMESYAGMARLDLVRGKRERATQWADAIAEFVLAGHRLEIYSDTPFIYWSCYGILKQSQDPRALLVLQQAYADYETLAATLPSAHDITLFWNVPLRFRLRVEALAQHVPLRTHTYTVPNSKLSPS